MDFGVPLLFMSICFWSLKYRTYDHTGTTYWKICLLCVISHNHISLLQYFNANVLDRWCGHFPYIWKLLPYFLSWFCCKGLGILTTWRDNMFSFLGNLVIFRQICMLVFQINLVFSSMLAIRLSPCFAY